MAAMAAGAKAEVAGAREEEMTGAVAVVVKAVVAKVMAEAAAAEASAEAVARAAVVKAMATVEVQMAGRSRPYDLK